MSANYIDFDAELQARGYRAKTWDGRYFTIVAPNGDEIGTTPFEDDIKDYAQSHYDRAIEEAQSLKKPVVEIWRFEDTPKALQNLSPHGGDEDYIVFVRDEGNPVVWQLEGGRFLGNDHWTRHEYDGEVIWIGAHA